MDIAYMPYFKWGGLVGGTTATLCYVVLAGSGASVESRAVERGVMENLSKEELEGKNDEKKTTVITLEELRKHNTEDSLWVTYGGFVYDVTAFVKRHPGGKDAILSAGGQDLARFWEVYPVHFERASTLDVLERHKIGRLEEDESTATENAPSAAEEDAMCSSVRLARKRHLGQTMRLFAVGFTGPLWSIFRVFLRIVGYVFPSFVDAVARHLPVSLPSFGESRVLRKGGRVAVIGGGISGVACAWALAKDGYEVTIFEARDKLGGNAQVGTFLSRDGTQEIRQDLSVLYWCSDYYRSYERLCKDLGVNVETVSLPYVLMTNKYGRREYFTPPGTKLYDELGDRSLETRFASDFEKYDRMVQYCRRVSAIFSDDSRSFYSTFPP